MLSVSGLLIWWVPYEIQQQGFYYDAFYGDLGLNDEHFKEIVSAAEKGVKVLYFLFVEKLIYISCREEFLAH